MEYGEFFDRIMKIDPNSILGYIRNSPHFKLYDNIITLARREGRFNDQQSNSTLFIAPDHILKQKYPKAYLICRFALSKSPIIINALIIVV